jgi:hypothetical protein
VALQGDRRQGRLLAELARKGEEVVDPLGVARQRERRDAGRRGDQLRQRRPQLLRG